MIISENRIQFYRTLNVLENWCKSNDMEINKKKSGVLIARIDKRTPNQATSFNGIPLVNQYRYLGIDINDRF